MNLYDILFSNICSCAVITEDYLTNEQSIYVYDHVAHCKIIWIFSSKLFD